MEMKGNESNEQPSGILIRSRVPQTLLTLLTLWGGVINPLLALPQDGLFNPNLWIPRGTGYGYPHWHLLAGDDLHIRRHGRQLGPILHAELAERVAALQRLLQPVEPT